MEAKLEGREWESICLGSHLLAFHLLNKLGELLPMFCSLVAGGDVLWSNCRKLSAGMPYFSPSSLQGILPSRKKNHS